MDHSSLLTEVPGRTRLALLCPTQPWGAGECSGGAGERRTDTSWAIMARRAHVVACRFHLKITHFK